MSDDPRFLTLYAPSGTGPFTVVSLDGSETLSAPFSYRILATTGLQAFKFGLLLGKSARLAIALDGGEARWICGVITHASLIEVDPRHATALYELELRPYLWLLSLHADCRVFQNKTVPQIVVEVLRDQGYAQVKQSLTGQYGARAFCVQYRESSLNFVTRLLEEEGIAYFFTHDDSGHTLVLADNPAAYGDCPHGSTARFRAEATAARDSYAITRCRWQAGLAPSSYGTDSYDFTTPSTSLAASSAAASDVDTVMGMHDFAGTYSKSNDGETLAKRRLEAYEAETGLLSAEGDCPAFHAGGCFTLTGHERDDMNARYLLRTVSVRARQGSYAAEFEAQPADTPFRPLPRAPKPRIPSTQTALVVGKPGEEVWVDSYGRVKVHFHWDRLGKKDDSASCWIRVAQGWAGKSYGMLFLPRVGQEVVVGFIDGDPDQPLITGAVYNAEQTLPQTLPAASTQSRIRTQSTPNGKGKFNELRFEDKTGQEQIFILAQKDYELEVTNDVKRTIKHDETITVENDRKLTVNNDSTVEVKQNHSRTVSEGNDTLTVEKGTRKVSVEDKETHSNGGDFSHAVKGSYKLEVAGDLTIKVDGDLSIEASSVSLKSTAQGVTLKAAQGMTLQAGAALSVKASTGMTLKSSAGATVEASTNLNLKGGVEVQAEGSMLTLKGSASGELSGGSMLAIKAGMVKIN